MHAAECQFMFCYKKVYIVLVVLLSSVIEVSLLLDPDGGSTGIKIASCCLIGMARTASLLRTCTVISDGALT